MLDAEAAAAPSAAPPAEATAAPPAEATATPPAIEQQEGDKPVSKRSLKRQAKAERLAEQKKQRKANEKAQKQEVQQKRKAEVQRLLDSMTEEEKEKWQQERKEKHQALMDSKKAAKARQHQALSAPQCVAIDLDFPALMTQSELKSLSQQLSYSYSSAVHGEQQLHLHLLGAAPELKAVLEKQLPGHVHWAATVSDLPYQEFFKERASDLVYLTADSPHELKELDSSKVYVIGGIVDRNRHKGLCFARAQQAGVATARLPIAQHVKLQSSAVITVNQVVEILVRMQSTPDWKAVLDEVLPGRKRANGAGAPPDQQGKQAPGSSAGSADASAEAAGAACSGDSNSDKTEPPAAGGAEAAAAAASDGGQEV